MLSKMTWEIKQIFTTACSISKNWDFDGVFLYKVELTKVYNAWAKKSIEESCGGKFEGKLTCAF